MTAAAVVDVEEVEVWVDDVLVTEDEDVDEPVVEDAVPVVLEDVAVDWGHKLQLSHRQTDKKLTEVAVALLADVVLVLEVEVAVVLVLVTEALVEASVGMPAAPATTVGMTGSLSAGNGERFFMRRFMFPWSRRCRGTSWASTAVARRRERVMKRGTTSLREGDNMVGVVLDNRLWADQAGRQLTHNSRTPSRGLVEGADKEQAKRALLRWRATNKSCRHVAHGNVANNTTSCIPNQSTNRVHSTKPKPLQKRMSIVYTKY